MGKGEPLSAFETSRKKGGGGRGQWWKDIGREGGGGRENGADGLGVLSGTS